MAAERRWLRAELIGPEGVDGEQWAGECADALACVGGLGVEEAASRGGRPVALAWLPESAARDEVDAALRVAGLAAEIAALETVADAGWVEAFNRTLSPVDIGRRLTVIPREGDAPPGRVALRIEPGRAFGTGHHESTRLALEWIEELLPPGGAVLDAGTGSGILAAAALALGASRVVAFDADPEAIEVAAENLRRTFGDDASRARLLVAASPPAGAFDLVVANIQLDVIVGMIDDLAARVAGGGALVLAGLLTADERVIDAALRRLGLEARWRRIGEWSAACARRP